MSTRDRMPFSKRIARWLVLTQLRKGRFAIAVGVSPPTVSDWLSGRTQPRSDRIAAIAKALGLSVSEFYGPIAIARLYGERHDGAKATG